MPAEILSFSERLEENAEKPWRRIQVLLTTHHLWNLSAAETREMAWNLIVSIAGPRIRSGTQPPIDYDEITRCCIDAERFVPFGY